MRANCIPIYWGNPLVDHDFNTKSFINYHDFERSIRSKIPKVFLKIPGLRPFLEKIIYNLTAYLMIRRIIQIDNNDALYERYLKEPWYIDDKPPYYEKKAKIMARLREIFGD